jgi:hypothetical protein
MADLSADVDALGPARPAEPTEPMTTKRRMPVELKRHLVKLQGGKYYLPAAYRLVWFRDECPDWGIRTQLVEGGHEAGFATVQATISNPDGRVVASGMKTESRQDFPAGWVEKAETGAIARALAVAGFGTQFAPELEDDGSRPADSPRNLAIRSAPASPSIPAATGPVWEGPGQCPRCHAPEGKRHGKPCVP